MEWTFKGGQQTELGSKEGWGERERKRKESGQRRPRERGRESAWPKCQSCIGMRGCGKGSPGAGDV